MGPHVSPNAWFTLSLCVCVCVDQLNCHGLSDRLSSRAGHGTRMCAPRSCRYMFKPGQCAGEGRNKWSNQWNLDNREPTRCHIDSVHGHDKMNVMNKPPRLTCVWIPILIPILIKNGASNCNVDPAPKVHLTGHKKRPRCCRSPNVRRPPPDSRKKVIHSMRMPRSN